MSGFGSMHVKNVEEKELHSVMCNMHDELVAEIERLKIEMAILTDSTEAISTFFKQLAAETKKPHYGEHAKGVVAALLLRAQEAGVYAPE